MNYNMQQPMGKIRKKGSQIKNGLLLMAIGLLAGAIPTVGSVLTILILVGMISIFLGSRDLSNSYRRFSTIALVLILIMIILEIVALSKVLSLMFTITNSASLAYSTIINATDPFLFMVSIAYVFLGASLVLISYPILPKSTRILAWIMYALTYAIFISEAYTQMINLNKMYYQMVTINNISVYSSFSTGIDIGAALFNLLWAIMFFITYGYARKMFPNMVQYGMQYPGAPQYTQSNLNQNNLNQMNMNTNTPPFTPPNPQASTYCPNCGMQNTPDAMFCSRCGYKLK